jgi:hypothetical protein
METEVTSDFVIEVDGTSHRGIHACVGLFAAAARAATVPGVAVPVIPS